MAMLSEDDNVSAPSASDAIAEAIRALVREELQQASPGHALAKEQKPAEEEPTWQDAFWLLVLIANIALVVGLVPEQVWKNPVLDVPGKILPWVGGGTFVLGTTWFRKSLMAFSRRNAFKIVMACAMVPLLMLHVRFLSLRPTIDPSDSQLFVDDVRQTGLFQGNDKIPLRLRSHTFRIQPYYTDTTSPREFGWSWTRLLKAWWGNEKPHWALVYPMRILTDGSGCTVHIAADGPLDSDFNDAVLKPGSDGYEFKPGRTSETIKLPAGKYSVSVDKQGCDLLGPKPVTVPSPAAVDLGPMQCQKR